MCVCVSLHVSLCVSSCVLVCVLTVLICVLICVLTCVLTLLPVSLYVCSSGKKLSAAEEAREKEAARQRAKENTDAMNRRAAQVCVSVKRDLLYGKRGLRVLADLRYVHVRLLTSLASVAHWHTSA